ncbi:hypothetical protein ASG76_09685 [Nocardioides sp. Soil774]|nr:hypothetical protein ASG76_09685 [Nocardioides sp. Soil774]
MGSALAAPLVLAACDIDPPARESSSGPATAPPPEDADLVASVVAELARAEAVLAEAATRSAALGAVRTAHAAHRELLIGAVEGAELPASEPVHLPDDPERALSVVRRSERRLQRAVREGCTAAASGDLARVLASIAASTAQHSAALSSEVAP